MESAAAFGASTWRAVSRRLLSVCPSVPATPCARIGYIQLFASHGQTKDPKTVPSESESRLVSIISLNSQSLVATVALALAMPMHQRRRPKSSDKVSNGGDSCGTSTEKQTRKRRKRKTIKSKCNPWWLLGISLLLVVVLRLVLHFLWGNAHYDWVYSRCLLSWTSLSARLRCMEAWYHREANLNEGLLWTLDLVPTLTEAQVEKTQAQIAATNERIAQRSTPTVKHVHYTLTAPWDNGHVQDLSLCSIESMAHKCQEARCRIHLWVVDRAASDLLQNNNTLFIQQLINAMSFAPHCIHVIDNPLEPHVPLSTIFPMSLVNNPNLHCPPPRTSTMIQRMRSWLATKEARTQQLPEHASDAWRLMALLCYGGLYLDLDVVPLSPLLLNLPYNSLPVQDRAGAYRLNGGVMRLGDGNTLELTATTPVLRSASFLDRLVEDHLYWAPRLATLPKDQQTFGFLGPAALTRVYCQISPETNEKVTVLTNTIVESPIGRALCEESSSTSLAVHLKRKLKYSFPSNVLRYDCLAEKFVTQVCPNTMARLKGTENALINKN